MSQWMEAFERGKPLFYKYSGMKFNDDAKILDSFILSFNSMANFICQTRKSKQLWSI